MITSYESAYVKRTLDTNKALRANILAGGERARQAYHALGIADVVNHWHQIGSDDAFEQAMNRYNSYCERVGYDPMLDFPS